MCQATEVFIGMLWTLADTVIADAESKRKVKEISRKGCRQDAHSLPRVRESSS